MSGALKGNSNTSDQNSSTTDDDISVIAVIKKGTSGIPKRARYHYIRELPLKSLNKMNNPRREEKSGLTCIDETPKGSSKSSIKNNNPRVIELSDKHSKMELRKQFKEEMKSPEPADVAFSVPTASGSCESLEILQKLPPGTVLIKQEPKNYDEDRDYVLESSKDSGETNSSGSSTISVTTEKVKKVHRTTRTKKIIEVRRNPTRVSKTRTTDKDFPRPRQRLLALKRRENSVDVELSKRPKLPTMPYMNTRSVTRKLYTVGATYQAPTIRDETEWKEWPVHGMHERPVFHPQVGLAAEYAGRYFTSLDGCTYREILEQPEIEVVSVDPRPVRMSLLNTKTKSKKAKSKSLDPLSLNDGQEASKDDNDSFEVCMHNSLHSVFAYCAQVMDPSYQKNVEKKLEKVEKKSEKPMEETEKDDADKPEMKKLFTISIKEHWKKTFYDKMKAAKEERGSSESYVENVSKILRTFANPDEGDANRILSSSREVTAPREPFINITKIKNAQTSAAKKFPNDPGTSKSHETFQLSQERPAVFVKIAECVSKSGKSVSVANCENVSKSNTDDLNLTKLEDSAISDETLMEMSSIYKKLVPSEDLISSTENSPTKGGIAKPSMPKQALPKICINFTSSPRSLKNTNKRENLRMVTVTEIDGRCVLPRQMRVTDVGGVINAKSYLPPNPSPNTSWNTNETSEIAKILSEYNQSLKRPGVQSMYYSSPTILDAGALRSRLKKVKIEDSQRDNKVLEKHDCEQGGVVVDENKEPNYQREKWNGSIDCAEEIITKTPECRQLEDNNTSGTLKSEPDKEEKLKPPRGNVDKPKGFELLNLELQRKQPAAEKRGDSIVEESKPEMIGDSEGGNQWLHELMENTAVLYCAAAGVHQDDLAQYVNSLDAKQSLQWLQIHNGYGSRGDYNSL